MWIRGFAREVVSPLKVMKVVMTTTEAESRRTSEGPKTGVDRWGPSSGQLPILRTLWALASRTIQYYFIHPSWTVNVIPPSITTRFSKRSHSGLFYPHERPLFTSAQTSGPLRPFVFAIYAFGPSMSVSHSSITSHTHLFCAFTSNILPTITHYEPHGSSYRAWLRLTLDPLPVAAVDVRFPTSLASD